MKNVLTPERGPHGMEARVTTGHRIGIAMMLVMVAVALAAVLGYAVLATVGMQAQISQNAAMIQQADCLAESGLNFAMYELENESTTIFQNGSQTWQAQTLAGVSGTYSVTIIRTGVTTFAIASTASVTGGSGSTAVAVNRSINTQVQLTASAVQANEAGGSSATTLNLLNLASLNITGGSYLVSASTSILGVNLNVAAALPGQPPYVPTVPTDFSVPYIIGGVTYTPTLLTSDPAAGTVLGPTATNPAGIYYVNNRLINLKGVTINGSLIIKSGGVEVSGGSTNVINPIEGYPGLVVNKGTSTVSGAGYLEVSGNNDSLTVNGLVWSQLGITKLGLTNTGSQITVNGSLLIPAATPFNSFSGTVNLNYKAANVNVPNFNSQPASLPSTVRVVSWSQ